MISTTVVMCENSLKNMDYQDHLDHRSQDAYQNAWHWYYNTLGGKA